MSDNECKKSIYNLLRKALRDGEDGYQEDFVNCFFNKMCQTICGVQCNDHYTEGPTHVNMAGCFIMQFDEKEADTFLCELFKMVDAGFIWADGWKRTN